MRSLYVRASTDPSRYRGLLFDRTNMNRVRDFAGNTKLFSVLGSSQAVHKHTLGLLLLFFFIITPYDLSIHIYPSSPMNTSGSSSFFFFLLARDSVCKLSPSITFFTNSAHEIAAAGFAGKVFATADNDARRFFFIKGNETGSVSIRNETQAMTAEKKTRKLEENVDPVNNFRS